MDKQDDDVRGNKRDDDLLKRMKQALRDQGGEVELGENEAYCEICSLKLQGDIEISVITLFYPHFSQCRHTLNLPVIFVD